MKLVDALIASPEGMACQDQEAATVLEAHFVANKVVINLTLHKYTDTQLSLSMTGGLAYHFRSFDDVLQRLWPSYKTEEWKPTEEPTPDSDDEAYYG